jgi:hypothetical protein
MKQNILTRDLWTMPAFRVFARIIGVLAAVLFLKKAILGFISGTITRRSWQFHGVDAYLYCSWYSVFAILLLCFALTPPRFWKQPVFVWPALSFGCLFAILAIVIAVHVSAH